MTSRTPPEQVNPARLLQDVRGRAQISRVAKNLSRRIDPPGTPFAKTRIGYVTAFDPQTWTVSATIGDQLTTITGIPAVSNIQPIIDAAGLFTEVSREGTTQYTLIGMLVREGADRGGACVRVRKTANQGVNNSTAIQLDADLKFYGLPGRTYIADYRLVMSMNFASNTTADFKYGWSLPTGASWTGGGPGPVASSAVSADRQATPSWKAFINTVGSTEYGSIATTAGDPVVYEWNGTIKMGATPGWCTVTWGQFVAVSGTTTVHEGSFLRADMTSEMTF